MTRVVTEWLDTSREDMERYGASVEALTGFAPARLAARAAARLAGAGCASGAEGSFASLSSRRAAFEDSAPDVSAVRAGVVRVTSGLGVIGGFADSLTALLSWLGADAFAPKETDVDGFYAAAKSGADVVFLADDDRFVCVNLASGVIAENDEATSYGYAVALDLMAGGLRGRDVLLIGYGRVGRLALRALKGFGASVFVFDKDLDARVAAAFDSDGISERGDIKDFSLIFDATDEGGWLWPEELRDGVLIAAPGLPPSLHEQASGRFDGRIFSDALQTGAAVMLYRALLP
ncbi:MAG: 3-methylornithyl-N6-L-lysine dehydrogenase PylD [Clostridiales Family XIII bacterium]|jgi:pyrrolysine biosynthesis protein PylD|nr:3-methylornithyl-N6-L-lysine dehydrogenase PylD [Clostridiales Family XIII bacterium]